MLSMDYTYKRENMRDNTLNETDHNHTSRNIVPPSHEKHQLKHHKSQ